ncbi:hypothetical protein [Sphingobacterium sp. LRF_L2]|uniref:hypothetical protein n=1 Tax=Sphingobacterium sp. LRF_L2 TaxID=3369421 RepID=UPI003F5FED62
MYKNRFTHLAKIYGIPCYFNEDNMEVKGTNWFFDRLIDLGTFLDTTFNLSDGFYVTDLQKLKKVD